MATQTQWPEYETASLKIKNEARKAVIERANRMAKELETDTETRLKEIQAAFAELDAQVEAAKKEKEAAEN